MDCNRYLEFSSFHPRHIFKAIVRSKAIRYLRIISDKQILNERLLELRGFFINSSYPPKSIGPILDEVKNMTRSLQYRDRSNDGRL